jgi:EAL and modified HD-GYP domain-containing signal transduction protein
MMNSASTNAAPEPPVDGIASLQRFLTRQPILDGNHAIVGYELKRRAPIPAGSAALPGGATPQQAEDEWLLASAIDLAFQRALGDKLTFLAIAADTLHSPLIEQLPKQKVVVALHPERSPPLLISRAEQLAHDGLQLALDDPADDQELASYARYVRLDSTQYDAMALATRVVRSLDTNSRKKPLLIATQVDTPEVYAACRKLSFNLYQGYYYTFPLTAAAGRLDSSSLRVMEVLNLVRNRAEFSEIERIFKLDPALSYRLLRYINSPAIGLRRTIESIGHALILLGHDQIYRWLTLLLFTGGEVDPRSQSLLRNALVRARFTEMLGREKLKPNERDGLFIVGIFSLLDALLNIPMTQALAGLHLPQAVTDALTGRGGIYGPYLNLALACEHFDQAAIGAIAADIGLDADAVNLAHVEALIWSESVEL